jgi:hypothetical protein
MYAAFLLLAAGRPGQLLPTTTAAGHMTVYSLHGNYPDAYVRRLFTQDWCVLDTYRIPSSGTARSDLLPVISSR